MEPREAYVPCAVLFATIRLIWALFQTHRGQLSLRLGRVALAYRLRSRAACNWRELMRHAALIMAICATALCSPAHADPARDMLVSAAFGTRDKKVALTRVGQAIAIADAGMKRDPRDGSSRLQHALGLSYRGKLTRSRSDVIAARRELEALVAADPRNPEAQMALGAWHLAAIIEFGPMLARTVVGARSSIGNQALDRALALGRDRASIPALVCLQRIQIDPSDISGARRLAEVAAKANTPTSFDRLMQRQALTLLMVLRDGNGKAAAATAKSLMPFGRITE
jgi:hypothetical protein